MVYTVFQTQDNLSSLMILFTETGILQNLSFDKTSEAFASPKTRKKPYRKILKFYLCIRGVNKI